MTRNLRTLWRRVKAYPRPRTESPQEIIARLERRAAELGQKLLAAEVREAELQRRNEVLAEDSLEQAGYIRFLTGKCVAFECDRLVRAVERGRAVV